MRDTKAFQESLVGRKVPVLTLDPKWHRLFAIHGKTDEIKSLEKELNDLLAEQGRLGTKQKDLRNLKANLLDNIVENMEGASVDKAQSQESKKLEENRRLIDEINDKLSANEDKLLEMPYLIDDKNKELMIASMDYSYDKMRVNEQEAIRIAEWINEIRIELKKNIIRKQNCETNSREIYEYMHDILGSQVIDLFDIEYEKEEINEADETEKAGAHPQAQE